MIQKLFSRKKRTHSGEIYPEDIFLDSSNLPEFDQSQFEGRIEKPIGKATFRFFGAALCIIGFLFLARTWDLQLTKGTVYAQMSENNRLRRAVIFPQRGLILDRNGNELAWNEPNAEDSFPLRRYSPLSGISHAVGYAKEPARDSSGNLYQDRFEGVAGAEAVFDAALSGKNGEKITETDARGGVISESVLEPPRDGETVTLSLDAKISDKIYTGMKELAERVGFQGGAAAIIDVDTGELIALVSYPEYDSAILSRGDDRTSIQQYLTNPRNPFLNRAVSGLYAPGSTVKPYVALGALTEGIISPEKQILSTGSISIPNPFVPGAQSVFKDWKAHGWVDMRHALSVSSDVYFYAIGGGYKDQKGLGIANIDKYMQLFGFGSITGAEGFDEPTGLIPTPEWKVATFDGDIWRLGDTYHTAIGQYGFQVTVLQEARAMAALGNGGILRTPTLRKGGSPAGVPIDIDAAALAVVREGMRLGVREGTISGLNVPYVAIAAKSGTAEIGTAKKSYVNSWITGYFPYEKPRYAFAAVMERGPVANTTGALYVMRQAFDWMSTYAPEYFEQN